MENGNGSRKSRQKIIVAALVENKPGVLNRVASMFRRRGFNIDSLTVGRTNKPHISRMTIVVDPERANPALIQANLYKLVNVIDVRILTHEPHVSRDLALIKVRADDMASRNAVTDLCERYPARIIDIGPEVAIIEMTAAEDVIETLVDEARQIGVVEMVRTGVVAMGRGIRIQDSEYQPAIPSGDGFNI
jgi:acetolactate synthase I/III small subunit